MDSVNSLVQAFTEGNLQQPAPSSQQNPTSNSDAMPSLVTLQRPMRQSALAAQVEASSPTSIETSQHPGLPDFPESSMQSQDSMGMFNRSTSELSDQQPSPGAKRGAAQGRAAGGVAKRRNTCSSDKKSDLSGDAPVGNPPVAEKACGRCNIVKPASEYHLNRSKPTGLGSWCKECTVMWYQAKPRNAPQVQQKKCTGCGLVKPASHFHRQSRLPTGLRIYCKKCEHERYKKKVKVVEPTVAEKRCTKCGLVKSADEYHKQRNVSTGLHSWCKECVAADYARHPRHRRSVPTEKLCTNCKETKANTAFKRDGTTADGLHPWCKDCAGPGGSPVHLTTEAIMQSIPLGSKHPPQHGPPDSGPLKADQHQDPAQLTLAELPDLPEGFAGLDVALPVGSGQMDLYGYADGGAPVHAALQVPRMAVPPWRAAARNVAPQDHHELPTDRHSPHSHSHSPQSTGGRWEYLPQEDHVQDHHGGSWDQGPMGAPQRPYAWRTGYTQERARPREVDVKMCRHCNEWRSIRAFFIDPSASDGTGVAPWCQFCIKAALEHSQPRPSSPPPVRYHQPVASYPAARMHYNPPQRRTAEAPVALYPSDSERYSPPPGLMFVGGGGGAGGSMMAHARDGSGMSREAAAARGYQRGVAAAAEKERHARQMGHDLSAGRSAVEPLLLPRGFSPQSADPLRPPTLSPSIAFPVAQHVMEASDFGVPAVSAPLAEAHGGAGPHPAAHHVMPPRVDRGYNGDL